MSKPWLYYLVLTSIAISMAGAIVSGMAWQKSNSRRALIAQSDYDLCSRIYSNNVAIANASLKMATVAHYQSLFPFMTPAQAANFTASRRSAFLREKEQFNPKQCLDLPSQAFK